MSAKTVAAGWAVMPKHEPKTLCFTSAPAIIGGGTIWQIYKTDEDALAFVKQIRWGDGSEYEVVPVSISWTR